jgi:hypothetical protein
MGTESGDFGSHLFLKANNNGNGQDHHSQSQSHANLGNQNRRTGNLLPALFTLNDAFGYKKRKKHQGIYD